MNNPSCAAILGATSGLGQAVARQLCSNAADGSGVSSLILVARNSSRLEEVADDLRARGATVTCVVADLDDIDAHEQLAATLAPASSFWFFYGSLPEQSDVQTNWPATEQSLRTNFLSPASLLTHIGNALEARGQGSIVVVGSVAGDRGRQSNYIYGTAKGALALFCQGLRNRLAPKGIPVLTVKPGFIDTPMTAEIEKKPAILWATPDKVASDIIKAHAKGKDVLYTPWFWRYILLIIKLVPERIFKKLSL